MRILFWSDTLWPVIGGVEVLAANFLKALRGRGYEIELITRQDAGLGVTLPERDDFEGMPLHRLPFQAATESRDVRFMMRVRQRLEQIRQAFPYDLAHIFHSGPSVLHYLILPAQPGVPMVTSLHQSFRFETLQADTMRGRLLRQADWIVSCSESVLAETLGQLPEIAGRSSVILNALPALDLGPAPLPLAEPRILCIGRVVPHKGFDVALQAFARLAGRYPRARLVIAGDGEVRPMLERLAERLGVAGSVDFLGWVLPRDIPALINRSTMLVVSSREEPFGLVALQAGQLGRPVVASRVDGLPEVVTDGQTGLLVPPDNPEALAEAVACLLDNPDMAERLGQAGRRHIAQTFDWERHVAAYDELFHRLVENKTHAAAH